MDSLAFDIFLIIILILLNGLFSAGEISIISSRKSKIKELLEERNDSKTRTLFEMKENPERFLSSVQIGITLFGTLASAVGGVIAVKHIMPIINIAPILNRFSESISVFIVVVILTYLFLVIGELVPKYIGMNYKEKAALHIAPVFDLTARLLFFFVNILTASTNFIVKGLNLKKMEEHIGEKEIKILIEEGRRKGVFDKTEEELIHGVFEFADKSVKDIMVPKPKIYGIDIDQSNEEIINYVVENEFSRYPVYKDHLDNIIGILYHKDITKYIISKEPFELQKLIRKPYFVPETMEISVLLKEMQKRHIHMAVVVDEYGTTVGIVTLEDIMEEIFGEIMDETDVDDRIERQKDGSIVIDGAYSIRDLNNTLHLNLPESPDYETLGGFMMTRLQGIAKGGEIVIYGRYKFIVVGVDERRITKVKLEQIRHNIQKINKKKAEQ
ncbi:MAG: hemolysin family protein [Syntrophorhabdaceae bacterium]|nr:hemolysin family protein [Syntrophorhabdaceae bacterium]